LPPGVLNYLPGRGEVVGAGLVEHPDVALLAFTGSRAVGLAINAKAAEVSKGKGVVNVKRVIAELGGKNAIIVDSDADLDEAVSGVVKSAFGYQGQKCSACSRAIVVGDVYEPFLRRLVEATKSLKIGPAEDPSTSVGPVIDGEAYERIKRYIEIGKTESRVALAMNANTLAEKGWYIGPHIFADVSPDARIAQEEIFGPVLAVIWATDLTEAHRRSLQSQPRGPRPRPSRVYGRQSVSQSLDHRRPRQPSTLWRLQNVRDWQQGRRPRLSAAVRHPPHHHRAHGPPRVCSASRRGGIV
jgi:RHH-type transcriptional regulator, proline utilization regulon repressor / proline dehydrogenase / delta 1-pyrroline-5-carboxylate dehydrogenase